MRYVAYKGLLMDLMFSKKIAVFGRRFGYRVKREGKGKSEGNVTLILEKMKGWRPSLWGKGRKLLRFFLNDCLDY